MRQQNNDECAEKTGIANHPTNPQVQDDAQNGQHGGRDHPQKGAQPQTLPLLFRRIAQRSSQKDGLP